MINKPIIILAPHLQYPLFNGADIYIERIGRFLSTYRNNVLILGNKTLNNYHNGEQICQTEFPNKMRNKKIAGLRTILFQSHYLVEKFITKEYQSAALKLIRQYQDSVIFYSMVASTVLNEHINSIRPILITHNDEIKWFQNLREFSNSPLHNIVARYSEKWVMKKFSGIGMHKFLIVHISHADYMGYEKIYPGHQAIILPVGVDITPLDSAPKWDKNRTVYLLFCGSLSVQMNFDALIFFKQKFWPHIRKLNSIVVIVAGSNPTQQIRQLCEQEKWLLYSNISDIELQKLYTQSTFALLPFPHSTGAKLKLLNFLVAGLPVMATINMKSLPGQNFFPNLYSDIPEEWRNHIESYRKNEINLQDRLDCHDYASQYSWQKTVSIFNNKLLEHGI